MTKQEYEELLSSDYWRGYSYSLIKERNYTCEDCGRQFMNERNKLQVHHLNYRNVKPWSYNPEELVVLCRKCHEKRHNIYSDTGWESTFLKIWYSICGIGNNIVRFVGGCSLKRNRISFKRRLKTLLLRVLLVVFFISCIGSLYKSCNEKLHPELNNESEKVINSNVKTGNRKSIKKNTTKPVGNIVEEDCFVEVGEADGVCAVDDTLGSR